VIYTTPYKSPLDGPVTILIVESDDGVGEIVQEIAQLERGQLRPEELGLTPAEAKGLRSTSNESQIGLLGSLWRPHGSHGLRGSWLSLCPVSEESSPWESHPQALAEPYVK